MTMSLADDNLKPDAISRNVKKFERYLEEFYAEVTGQGIWFSQEMEELKKGRVRSCFRKVILQAMNLACQICVESTPPRGRYIKIHSRYLQRQMFIKIEFPCEEIRVDQYAEKIFEMQSTVEKASGYFKYIVENEQGTIRIAFPA